jgi:hypothetical protein
VCFYTYERFEEATMRHYKTTKVDTVSVVYGYGVLLGLSSNNTGRGIGKHGRRNVHSEFRILNHAQHVVVWRSPR